MDGLSVYIHVPFCLSRCSYCNFYSTTELEVRPKYIEAVNKAILSAGIAGRDIATIYFGGGTPSLLGTELLKILDTLRTHCNVLPEAEITLEANPKTVDLAMLILLRKGGFNRISFGLQAADDGHLRGLGRAHTFRDGVDSIELAKQAGFTNISVDIMLGTPYQTIAGAIQLAETVLKLHVPHISAYLLKIEPDTPFGRSDISETCPDPDDMADIYLAVCSRLEAAGYCHYEISNFALPGFESQHNSAYWQLTDYLGIGPAAYSYMDGKRFSFPPSLANFVESPNVWDTVVVDGPGGDFEEYAMLSLRLAKGLSLQHAGEKYGADITAIKRRAQQLENHGYVKVINGHIRLTNTGFLMSNSIITNLLG